MPERYFEKRFTNPFTLITTMVYIESIASAPR